uniref:Uncharacterized protein n=1 Tax=Anopheles culicifacies TaxID=139723 RepID=A0A182MU90_9DIPT
MLLTGNKERLPGDVRTVGALTGLNGAHNVVESIRTIFFYPKWMYEEFHKDPNGTIAEAFRKGYEVVYDLDNTMEIFHWNRFSRQTITIDPHNIVVPDEVRDLHGFELELFTSKYHNQAMNFDAYLLEQLSKRINATSAVAE